MLEGLQATEHSLARSHYWPPRGLLAAGCGPWPGSPLVRQPEPLRLLGGAHVDASLSADAGSTWPDDQQGSLPQAIPSTCLLVAGLQEHATTPGDNETKLSASQQDRSIKIRLAGLKWILQGSVWVSNSCCCNTIRINKDVFYPSSGEKASPAPSILLAERKLSHYIIYAQRMDSRLGVDRFVSCRIWLSVFALRDVTLYQICSF